MLPQSGTAESLVQYPTRPENSASPLDMNYASPDSMHTIPLPVLTRQTSQQSYCSTTELITHRPTARHPRRSISQRLLSWSWKRESTVDAEVGQQGLSPETKPEGGGGSKSKRIRAWHGWEIALFHSWWNLLILLIPTSWIIKLLIPNSQTLIFTSCVLAMIPLVKLHDLATEMLSRRIGGSKTGLLNASMSNVVGLVLAISALRKCELRIVQSSLIGSMLSKMLLILGMCFFAGGIRFSHQDYNSTATQIHSSLLGLSVGAVCLPAAYHFALNDRFEDALESGAPMGAQGENLLQMSHGVAVVMIFIYISYLLFQLWSHTHLYKDNTIPSEKLPKSVSVRSVTKHVVRKKQGKKGNQHHSKAYGHISKHASMLSAKSVTEHGELTPSSPRFQVDDELKGNSPYRCYTAAVESRDGLLSPHSTTSQTTLSPGVPTVRLLHDDRESVWEISSYGSAEDDPGSTSSCESEASPPRPQHLHIVIPEGHHYHASGHDGGSAGSCSSQASPGSADSSKPAAHEEEQMSWTMTLLLLTIVTVLVTVNSEWLVDSMDSMSPYIDKEWIGLILLPAVSSIAECATAITVSYRDKLSLSINVAVGSTIQTALLVIPSMVLLGWALGKPLAMLFDPFESVVLYISVHVMGYVVADGKSNWLEGMILICLYVIIAVTFWFYPGSAYSSTVAICS